MTILIIIIIIKKCQFKLINIWNQRKKKPVTCNLNRKSRASDWFMLMTWKSHWMKERAKGRIMTQISMSIKFDERIKLRIIWVLWFFGNIILRNQAYINKKARKKTVRKKRSFRTYRAIRLNEIVGSSIYNLKIGKIGSSQEIRILKLEI